MVRTKGASRSACKRSGPSLRLIVGDDKVQVGLEVVLLSDDLEWDRTDLTGDLDCEDVTDMADIINMGHPKPPILRRR